MGVCPPEKWCIFNAAFLAADQRARVISAPTVASCSFPAKRQTMVAHSYEVERRHQEQIQRESQRISGTTLDFSSGGRLEAGALYSFHTDSQKEAEVFVARSNTKTPHSQFQHSHSHFGKSCTSARQLGAHAELDKEHDPSLSSLPSSENPSTSSLPQSLCNFLARAS